MNTDDDARCREIERRLKAGRKYGDEVEWAIQAASDLRFLIDLARTADAMLRTAFLDHGLDVDALLAEAERRAVVQIVGLCSGPWSANSGGWIADFLKIRHSLPPLEEPQQ